MELSPALQAELNELQRQPKLTRSQKRRMRILQLQQQELRSRIWPTETHALGTNEPAPKYKPLTEYPKFNTRVNPLTDVLYQRPPTRDINSVMDWEWVVKNNPSVQAAFPKGVLETQRHYVTRVVEELKKRKQNLDLLNQSIAYNPDPTAGYFAKAARDPKQRLYTTLDIETDDYGRPISISASRLQWNERAQTFNTVDSYQRFYLAKNEDLLSTFDVHGMTSAKLLSLRDQQKARYSLRYNEKEQQGLKEYLGNSIILGHNIVDFDLNRLFPDEPLTNSTIDTLKAARSAWKGRENALHNVFYRLYGKTMEEMGLSHHDPNADTIAAAMIAAKMFGAKGVVGAALRYVRESADPAHIAEWDSMMQSMVTTGTYRSMYSADNLYEVFKDMKEIMNEYGQPIGTNEELDQAGMNIKTYGELADIDTRAHMQHMQEQIDAVAGVVNASRGTGIEGHLSQELFEAVNTFNTYKHFDLVRKVAGARSREQINAMHRAYGQVEGSEWASIVDAAKTWREAEDRDKKTEYLKRIDKYRARGDLTGKQYKELHNIDHLRMSYDELRDATEDMIEANHKLEKTYRTLTSIKPYDVNQYINSAKNQWSGITGAARGVIPNFIRNPLSRLGDAAFNAVDRSISPWNAAGRTWNAVGQPLMSLAGGMLGGLPGAVAGAGLGATIGGATQIFGNYKQAKMEMAGNLLQNNLNTLGAMISWITTPFQLLGKAIKLVTGAFGGLTFKLNSFMGSGLEMMNQMGQPLTELTGMSYADYAGSKMLDRASLLPGGSMNSVYENFAYQQQGLYMGQIDTNRMIASSMLGVYGDVYGSAGEKSDEVYNRMANKLLANMATQSPEQQARTMYFASQIDKNLPSVLRTANLLGVTDVSQLSDPTKRGMYWNPVSKDEERNFRWAQYEYGAAKEQLGVSKMRFANTLWSKMGGKQIYNAFNELVDTAATGNWEGALKRAGEIWDEFRERFSGVWEAVQKTFSGEGGEENGIVRTLKAVGLQIENVAISAGLKIVSVWDDIMVHIIEKLQGAIAYLSTIHLKPHWDWENGLSFSMTSIADEGKAAGNARIYDPKGTANEALTGRLPVAEGMQGYADLAEVLFPNIDTAKKGWLTVDDLWLEAGKRLYNGETINLPQHGLSLTGTSAGGLPKEVTIPQDLNTLMTQLGRAGKASDYTISEGMGNASALFLSRYYGGSKNYGIAGLGDVARSFTGAGEDVLTTVLSDKYNNNARAIAELRIVDEHGKKATMIADTEKGSAVSKDFVLLSQMLGQGLKLIVNEVK